MYNYENSLNVRLNRLIFRLNGFVVWLVFIGMW